MTTERTRGVWLVEILSSRVALDVAPTALRVLVLRVVAHTPGPKAYDLLTTIPLEACIILLLGVTTWTDGQEAQLVRRHGIVLLLLYPLNLVE